MILKYHLFYFIIFLSYNKRARDQVSLLSLIAQYIFIIVIFFPLRIGFIFHIDKRKKV